MFMAVLTHLKTGQFVVVLLKMENGKFLLGLQIHPKKILTRKVCR